MTPIGASDRDLLGLVLLVALLAVTAAIGSVAYGAIRKRRSAVPPGLRPGPSDEDLERRIQTRYRVWGAIMTVFLALFLPVYWFREPTRLEAKEEQFLHQSIERGAKLWAPTGSNLVAVGCAGCHGNQGEGGVRTFTSSDGRTLTMAEPPLAYFIERYKAAGRNDEEIKQILRDAIERGRPGTPMPTWGLQFGGPLHSQQVDDLVNFVMAPAPDENSKLEGASVEAAKEGFGLQRAAPKAGTARGEVLFDQNCAICHGSNGQGGVGPNLTVAFARNSAAQIEQTIKEGRINFGRPSMPAWAHLGDEAIDALVEFLQSIQRG